MGRRRSKSVDHADNESLDAVDEYGSMPKSVGSKKSKFADRWKKFSGNKEWRNGCGPATEDDEGLEHSVVGPPILSIEVDTSKEVDLTARVKKKSEVQLSKEFAQAARIAVQQQMKELESELECSDHQCHGPAEDSNSATGSAVLDLSTKSLPPPSMNPTPLLKNFGTAKIQEIILQSPAQPTLGKKVQTRDLVFRHSGTNGCLVFVIRRPGCLLCREQALYLKFLFQNYPKEVEGFTIVGVVKEFCESGGEKLQEFHDTYFPFPLYLDIERAAYKALGNRKASLGAALKVLNPFSETSKRIRRNHIQGNMKGEGFLQGGVIIYHKHGMAAYKYEEETGLELPVNDIVKALRQVRRNDFVPILAVDADTDSKSVTQSDAGSKKTIDESLRTAF